MQGVALDTISSEIRTATTSMTSVPKPLKFLRPHYATLKAAYEAMPPGPNRGKLADVISVLAITTGEEGQRESLKFRLAGHTVLPHCLSSSPHTCTRVCVCVCVRICVCVRGCM